MVRSDAKRVLHKAKNCLFAFTAFADDADHLVDIAHRVNQALKAMRLLLGLAQKEASSAANDFFSVVDVALNNLAHAKGSRLVVDQRDVDNGEGALQWCVFVQLLLDDRGVCAFFQHHHNARLRITAGVIAHIGDIRNTTLAASNDNLLDQIGLHNLIWNLIDDDGVAAAFLGNMHAPTQSDFAAARGVGLHNSTATNQDSASWKIGPRQNAHKFFQTNVWIVDHLHNGVAGLAEIVRRHTAGHAYGNA